MLKSLNTDKALVGVEAFTEYPPLGRFAVRDSKTSPTSDFPMLTRRNLKVRQTVAVGVIKSKILLFPKHPEED